MMETSRYTLNAPIGRLVWTALLMMALSLSMYGQTTTDPLSIDGNGNVGIGISLPKARMHVEGTTFLNGNVGIGTNASEARLEIRPNNVSNPDKNGLYIYNTLANNVNAHAIACLRVNGAAAGDPFVSFDVSGVVGWALGIDNSDDQKFKIGNQWENVATNTKLTIQKNGFVGIGTSTPKKQLEIRTDRAAGLGPTLLLQNNTGGAGAGGSIDFNGYDVETYDPTFRIQSLDDGYASSHLAFFSKKTGGVKANSLEERMRITSGGNIGIGTNAPEAKLEIRPNAETSPSKNGLYIYNDKAAKADAHAIAALRVNGDKAGDPYVSFDVAGFTGWSIGIDNSDDQKLKFSNAWDNIEVNTKMTIQKNGWVGIGTTTPRCGLQVESFANLTIKDFYFMFQHECRRVANGNDNKVNSMAIYSSLGIQTNYGFFCTSDERHKKDFVRSNPADDLRTLNALEVTDFVYKDVVNYGDEYHKGFIAQQVESVYPQAIEKVTAFIPDIYDLPTENTIREGRLWVKMGQAHHLHDSDEVRLIGESGPKEVFVQVIDSLTFTVPEWAGTSAEVFVFGKRVDDFRSVNYDALYTLGVSSIQEISRQLNVVKTENEALKHSLSEMEARMMSRMEALESKLILLEVEKGNASVK